MATSPLLIRATIPDVNGIAADAIQNSFVFASSDVSVCRAAVLEFFQHSNTSAAIGAWLAQSRTRVTGACTLQTYELDGFLHGEPHGSPIDTFAWTCPAAFDPTNMPDQCAVVLSYHGVLSALPEHGGTATRPTPESAIDMGAPAIHSVRTRPRAGLRGRLYIGPLDGTALDTTTGDVKGLLLTDLAIAAARLVANAAAWSVWSRVQGIVTPIVGGWVDKQFGIVRRRVDKSLTRAIW